MNNSEIIKIAFRSVRNNLLRAILTLMIIALGIMALVGILTAIDNMVYSLNDNFSGLGANSFTISPKGNELNGSEGGRRQKRGEPISYKEALEFKDRFDYPARVSVSADCTARHRGEPGATQQISPSFFMQKSIACRHSYVWL